MAWVKGSAYLFNQYYEVQARRWALSRELGDIRAPSGLGSLWGLRSSTAMR